MVTALQLERGTAPRSDGGVTRLVAGVAPTMTNTAVFRALEVYAARGYRVRTGLSPWHFRCNSYRNLPLASLFADGSKLGVGGGIGFGEMFFFEALCAVWQPTRILVIGNAFGLSSVLLAMASPGARVVAIDAGVEGIDNARGTELTRRIAREEGLNLEVVDGRSPRDVPAIAEAQLQGELDLAFVDGLHTDEQQELDFEACWRLGRDRAIYCLHDVLNYELTASFSRIQERHGAMRSRILWRCVSGMGLVYPDTVSPDVVRVIESFTEPPDLIERTRREVALDGLLTLAGRLKVQRALPAWLIRAAKRLIYGA